MNTTKLAVRNYNGLKIINFADILYCKADGRYTWIHLRNGEYLVSAKTLKAYEVLLPESLFLRIHKSIIVNMNHVRQYDKRDGGFITMDNGQHLSIAKRRKREFQHRFSEIAMIV